MAGESEVTSEVNNLGGFVEAARNYGVEGIMWHKEGDNSVLEQEVGKGWPGMGYDTKENVGRLWMGLAPEGRKPNQGWNENTLLEPGKVYKGVTPGEKGMVTSEHPLAILFGALQKNNPDLQLHVTGEHAEWQTNENTRLILDDKGNLVGNIPLGKEIKTVVTPVQAKWTDRGWQQGAPQRLEILATK